MRDTKSGPVHHIRRGNISASIFRNVITTSDGVERVRHNVSFSRSYTVTNDGIADGEPETKWSQSFGRDDLHLVQRLCQACEDYIYAAAKVEREEGSPVPKDVVEERGADGKTRE